MKKKFWKNNILPLILAGLICLSLSATVEAAREGVTGNVFINRNPEVILLFDASASMQSFDTEHKLPMIYKEILFALPSNYNVGLIAFDSGIHRIEFVSPARESISHSLDKIVYHGYTDTGEAMQKAVELFEAEISDFQTIILLTDGEIHLETEQETSESKEIFQAAVSKAAERNIKLHVIALGGRANIGAFNIYDESWRNVEFHDAYNVYEASEVAKHILFSDIAIQKLNRSLDSLGNGKYQFRLPAANIDEVDVLLTYTQENAKWTIENGKVFNGTHYSLATVKNPQTDTLRLACENVIVNMQSQILLEARVKLDGEGIIKSDTEGDVMELTLRFLHDGDKENVLKDSFYTGKRVDLIVNNAVYTAKVNEAGELVYEIPYDGRSVALDMQLKADKLGVNFILPEDSQIEIAYADSYTQHWRYALIPVGGIALVALLLIIRQHSGGKLAGQGFFGGRLYIRNIFYAADNVPDQNCNLMSMFPADIKQVSLAKLLAMCNISLEFSGAEGIILETGPNKTLKIINNSACTILKDRELVENGSSCFLSFTESIKIVFADEKSGMVLQYETAKL